MTTQQELERRGLLLAEGAAADGSRHASPRGRAGALTAAAFAVLGATALAASRFGSWGASLAGSVDSAQMKDAVSDPVEFNNVAMITNGYHIFYADPSPISANTEGGYKPYTGMYLGGYAAGDGYTRDLEQSKKRCDELKTSCGGVTCSGTQCTVRAGTEPKSSPSGEVSYLKQAGGTQLPSVMPSKADPGMRKPVFVHEYTRGKLTADRRHKQPDGYHATVDAGCSKVFVSKSIKNEYEYTRETSKELSLTAGVEASVGLQFPPADEKDAKKKDDGKGSGLSASAGASLSAGVSGTLSYTTKSIRTETTLLEQVMERSTARCSSYVAAIEFGDFPKTHPEFQKSVDALSGKGNEDWWNLFDAYGTHFFTSVSMGARTTVTSYFRTATYTDMRTEVEGFGVSVGASVSAAAGVSVGTDKVGTGQSVDATLETSADLLSPPESSAVDTIEKYIQKLEVSVVGPQMSADNPSGWWDAVVKNPVPVRFDKRDICLHPVFSPGTLRQTCATALQGYCKGRLEKLGAPCSGFQERECSVDLDCKADYVCREYKCKAEPICKVVLCEGGCTGSSRYEYPPVTATKFPFGQTYYLENGNWWNRVTRIELSDGCQLVEAVDDDGACEFGKGDNGRYTSSVNLPYDLQEDVCMLKVWAKPVPGGRRLGVSNSSLGFELAPNEVPGLAEVNRRLALRALRRRNLTSLGDLASLRDLASLGDFATATEAVPAREPLPPMEPALAGAADAMTELVPQTMSEDSVSPPATMERETDKTEAFLAAGNVSSRRLADTVTYVKNIGKAMYGYNHFFGAPLSAANMGKDPGFVHRALWSYSYNTNTFASAKVFNAIPKGTTPSLPPGPMTTNSYQVFIGYYLGGYAASDSTVRSVADSEKRCDELRDQCGGITCDGAQTQCTVRSSTTIAQSPSGEVTFKRAVDSSTATPQDTYQQLNRQYLGGYASGDSTVRSVAASKKRCNDLGTTCGGVTCDAAQAKCTVRASTTPKTSPSNEVTFKKIAPPPTPAPKPSYQAFAASYLAGYASGDLTVRSVAGSQDKCDELGTQCGGVTCDASQTKCTVRAATTPESSSNGEVTFKKIAPGDAPTSTQAPAPAPQITFKRLDGKYLGGYAAGDSAIRNQAESEKRCKELGSSCGGFTCNSAVTSCTVRASTTPAASPTFEVTFQKVGGRRLSADPAPVLAPAPLAAGPPRRLAVSKTLVPDGWKVTYAESIVCETEFTSKEIKSQFAYTHEMEDSMSMGFDIGFVSFGYSEESKEFADNNGESRKMLVTTTAECLEFTAEIKDLNGNPPPVNKAFDFVVGTTQSEEEYYALFDMFGLSFPTKVAFGARYGFSRYIDEQNYVEFLQSTGSQTVTVGVSYTVGVDKGGASAGITISAEAAGTMATSKSTKEAVEKHFTETREYSVGKRMPDKGGITEWMKNVGDEPMPMRVALTSICEHPSFIAKGKKEDCDKYRERYCPNHLQRENPKLSCTAPLKPECLWDLDCGEHQECSEGSCVDKPACWVKLYENDNFQGSSQMYGPTYRSDEPVGHIYDTGGMGRKVSSVQVSGGCEEVTLMDEDKCMLVYEDNIIVELRSTNYEKKIGDLPYDLDDDICKLKLLAKEKWVK